MPPGRRVAGAKRAFAVAGCASVVAYAAVGAVLAPLLSFVPVAQLQDEYPFAATTVLMVVFLVPAVAVDVAVGFVLGKWGKGRPILPDPPAAPAAAPAYRAAGEGNSDPWDDLVQ